MFYTPVSAKTLEGIMIFSGRMSEVFPEFRENNPDRPSFIFRYILEVRIDETATFGKTSMVSTSVIASLKGLNRMKNI